MQSTATNIIALDSHFECDTFLLSIPLLDSSLLITTALNPAKESPCCSARSILPLPSNKAGKEEPSL